jgi:pimeloyl-ACP methyl ester carboxylesterase
MGNAWPQKVRRLVLVSLAAYEAPVRAEKLRNIGRFPTPKPDASNVTDLFRLQGTMVDARASMTWRHAALAESLRAGARLPWGYIAVYNHDFLGSLAALTQEVMILAPQDDLWDVTRRTASIVPRGTMVELPGAAHGFMAIDTDKVCDLIRSFLDR